MGIIKTKVMNKNLEKSSCQQFKYDMHKHVHNYLVLPQYSKQVLFRLGY